MLFCELGIKNTPAKVMNAEKELTEREQDIFHDIDAFLKTIREHD